ncbi:Hypothetical predicted protein [Octopus vulgaris]|uniref:Uncharacterized protein n=1 Tax=Octopus vulgaris TaxID=6645 RepID=A0AA36BBR3_OCTVU|nr:Hypothetical predicted protein [Octopus vulgaris]
MNERRGLQEGKKKKKFLNTKKRKILVVSEGYEALDIVDIVMKTLDYNKNIYEQTDFNSGNQSRVDRFNPRTHSQNDTVAIPALDNQLFSWHNSETRWNKTKIIIDVKRSRH